MRNSRLPGSIPQSIPVHEERKLYAEREFKVNRRVCPLVPESWIAPIAWVSASESMSFAAVQVMRRSTYTCTMVTGEDIAENLFSHVDGS